MDTRPTLGSRYGGLSVGNADRHLLCVLRLQFAQVGLTVSEHGSNNRNRFWFIQIDLRDGVASSREAETAGKVLYHFGCQLHFDYRCFCYNIRIDGLDSSRTCITQNNLAVIARCAGNVELEDFASLQDSSPVGILRVAVFCPINSIALSVCTCPYGSCLTLIQFCQSRRLCFKDSRDGLVGIHRNGQALVFIASQLSLSTHPLRELIALSCSGCQFQISSTCERCRLCISSSFSYYCLHLYTSTSCWSHSGSKRIVGDRIVRSEFALGVKGNHANSEVLTVNLQA